MTVVLARLVCRGWFFLCFEVGMVLRRFVFGVCLRVVVMLVFGFGFLWVCRCYVWVVFRVCFGCGLGYFVFCVGYVMFLCV